MGLSIERMLESFISAIGLGKHSAIIVASLGIIYFLLNQTYKSVNYKFYKIPKKYFNLIDFKELVIYSIIIIIIIFIVSYSFLDVITSSIILNFLLFIFILALVVADIFYKFFDKNIKINTSLNKHKLTKQIFDNMNAIIVALVIYTIVFYTIFYFLYKLSFYNVIIGILIYLTTLNIIILVLNYFSEESNLFLNIYNNDIGRCIFYIIEIIYVFLILTVLFSISSSLINSNKILSELDKKRQLYFDKERKVESTTVTVDKNEVVSDDQHNLQTLSDHIINQINDSSNWGTREWVYNFKNAEHLIASYYDVSNMKNLLGLNIICEIIDSKSYDLNSLGNSILCKDRFIQLKDLCQESSNQIVFGHQFLALLKNADMMDEFLNTIKLLIILKLLTNSTVIIFASIALVLFIIAYIVIVTYIYFNPSNIREYEFVEDDNENKKYIITEYKNTVMVMPGTEVGNTLYLFTGNYKFINLEQCKLIKLKEYKNIKRKVLYGCVYEYNKLINSKKFAE